MIVSSTGGDLNQRIMLVFVWLKEGGCQTKNSFLCNSLHLGLKGHYMTICFNTVSVRNPDVRISAFFISVRLLNRPDFRQRLLTGQYCPVIGRLVGNDFSVLLSDVQFQLLPTGRLIQPVPNRFRTSLEPVLV